MSPKTQTTDSNYPRGKFSGKKVLQALSKFPCENYYGPYPSLFFLQPHRTSQGSLMEQTRQKPESTCPLDTVHHYCWIQSTQYPPNTTITHSRTRTHTELVPLQNKRETIHAQQRQRPHDPRSRRTSLPRHLANQRIHEQYLHATLLEQSNRRPPHNLHNDHRPSHRTRRHSHSLHPLEESERGKIQAGACYESTLERIRETSTLHAPYDGRRILAYSKAFDRKTRTSNFHVINPSAEHLTRTTQPNTNHPTHSIIT